MIGVDSLISKQNKIKYETIKNGYVKKYIQQDSIYHH